MIDFFTKLRYGIVSALCAVSLAVAPVLVQAKDSVSNNEWKGDVIIPTGNKASGLGYWQL
jgi:hypothetical protein